MELQQLYNRIVLHMRFLILQVLGHVPRWVPPWDIVNWVVIHEPYVNLKLPAAIGCPLVSTTSQLSLQCSLKRKLNFHWTTARKPVLSLLAFVVRATLQFAQYGGPHRLPDV